MAFSPRRANHHHSFPPVFKITSPLACLCDPRACLSLRLPVLYQCDYLRWRLLITQSRLRNTLHILQMLFPLPVMCPATVSITGLTLLHMDIGKSGGDLTLSSGVSRGRSMFQQVSALVSICDYPQISS